MAQPVEEHVHFTLHLSKNTKSFKRHETHQTFSGIFSCNVTKTQSYKMAYDPEAAACLLKEPFPGYKPLFNFVF